MSEKNVIIMDDDADYANFILDVAEAIGWNCTVITNPNNFMDAFDSNVALIFLDLNIPNIDGIDLLRFIEKKQSNCDIILMSGVDDRTLEAAMAFAQSINLSVVGRFQKTIRLAELEDMLKKLTLKSPANVEQPLPRPEVELIISKQELTRAINNNEFIAYYQPKIDIATRGLYGVEALIRWVNPDNKMIFPDEFIPQAEALGLIDEMTWLMMKNAIKDIRELHKEIQIPFKLALNLSPSSLKDLEFPQKFFKVIEQFSFPPEYIILEITESGLIKELSSALEIFARLSLKKVQLSIDDFGTGYAMMKQLKIIPASEIKIDKSFVQNALLDNSSRITVKKLIEMGHELGMKVVAEGVETVEQLQYLQSCHCDLVQGYYFGKPMSLNDLRQWINTHYGFS